MLRDFEVSPQRVERLDRPLVFTNGVFDLLHAGHVHCLEEARKLGRSLVVGINSDASSRRRNKGPGRPFNAEHQRCCVVAALRCVDAVFMFEQELPLDLLRQVRPDIYVKGNDYELTTLAEARIVAAWGGRTVLIPRHAGLSSTLLVGRVLVAYGHKPPVP